MFVLLLMGSMVVSAYLPETSGQPLVNSTDEMVTRLTGKKHRRILIEEAHAKMTQHRDS